MNLTDEQQRAFDIVKQGKSIFLTGPGGTGKSFLLKAMYDYLDKQVAVTAMTGCAAVLLGKHAKTLHSWAGIGLATETPKKLAAKIRNYKRTLERWLGTDVLIIDEVSMMTPELLETLNEVAKLVRRDESPMGGLQLVFVGDFYQLPPVVKEGETSFVFESPLWNEIVQETVCLTQILRQTDPIFHKILEEARKGALTKESFQILKEKSKDRSWESFEIKPTLLYTRRATVDRINEANLKALPGDPVILRAKTVFQPTASTSRLTRQSPEVLRVAEQMDRDSSYMPELRLKKGAQVMLLSNLNYELGRVNGARGVVVGFDGSEENRIPIVQFKTGTPVSISKTSWMSSDLEGVGREQVPLKLAYAITVHKAQGATLDCALIDIGSSTFECGQAYVALSRVKNLESLYVWDVEPTAFRAHPKVSDFYHRLEQMM